MPAGSVKTERDERLWEKAKGAVAEQYPDVAEDSDRYWKLVQGVYQKMHGEKSLSGNQKGEAAMKSAYDLAAAAEELRKSVAVSAGSDASLADSASEDETGGGGTLSVLAKGLLGAVALSQRLLKGAAPNGKTGTPEAKEAAETLAKGMGEGAEGAQGPKGEEKPAAGAPAAKDKEDEDEDEEDEEDEEEAEEEAELKKTEKGGLSRVTTLKKSPSAESTINSIVNRTGDKAGDEDLPVLLAEPLLKSLVEVHGELAEQLGAAFKQIHGEIQELRKGLAVALKVANATAQGTAAILLKSAEREREPISAGGRGILGQAASFRPPQVKGISADGTLSLDEANSRLHKAGLTRGDVQVKITELIAEDKLGPDAMNQFLSYGHVGFVANASPDLRKALGLD